MRTVRKVRRLKGGRSTVEIPNWPIHGYVKNSTFEQGLSWNNRD